MEQKKEWYSFFSSGVINHFVPNKNGKNENIILCDKFPSSKLDDLLIFNREDKRIEKLQSFNMKYLLDSYKYLWAWSMNMELVGELYTESQHQWIESAIRA